jgi:hypothetical protein
VGDITYILLKRHRIKKTFSLLMLLVFLAGCGSNRIPDYVAYKKIPPGYSLENAKNDGLVVYENGSITSGHSMWDLFVDKTGKKEPCNVRLAFYYTLENQNISPELYEEIKDDYPALYIQDLSFDGNSYTLYSVEDGKEYAFQYKFLVHLTEASPPSTAIYVKREMYVLVNNDEVTWEQIQRGMFSSIFGDYINHKTVYSKYTYFP